MSRARTIFLDMTGRRARAANCLLVMMVLAICIGVGVVAFGIVNAPHLRSILTSARPAQASGPLYHQRHMPGEQPILPARNRHVAESAREAMRLAFYDDADIGSFQSLKHSASKIDGIIPDWLDLTRHDNRFELKSAAEISQARGWIENEAPGLAIYPQLTTKLTTYELLQLLAQPHSRADLIAQIADYLSVNDFQGVAVALSELPPSSHRTLVIFLDQLGRAFHAENRKVMLVAEPDAEGRRLGELARVADYTLIQTHDHTFSRDWAGPTAGQGWFEERVQRSLDAVPPNKLIVTIGSHGYDWDPYGGSVLLSVQQAWDRLVRTGSVLKLDEISLNPTFSYRNERGLQHEVWFLDAVTAFNQAKAALAVHPAGLAIWRLGLEDPGIWSFAGRGTLPDESTRPSLNAIEPGYGAFEQARGKLLSAAAGAEGARTIRYNPGLGLIVAQSISSAPRQAQLSIWRAADPKSLAITFDDGPDPRYTPQILDVLAHTGAKATFYALGKQVLAHPDIARRIVAEGHDIGNHTFLHPNTFEIGPDRLAAELTATQRVFETQLGLHSILFRPPYAMSGFDYLESVPILTRVASELGYLFGGIDIDGYDYYTWTADQIAGRVIEDVLEGQGQVILLHDSGGDRTATIHALPLIIDTLQAKGYRFVATHELVGMRRDDVLQPFVPATLATRAEAAARTLALDFSVWFTGMLPLLAISTAVLGIARLMLIVMAALVQRSRRQRPGSAPFGGSVAVLVPAFNEETVVCKTVHGLLTSTIAERLTISVIDDGSTDRTSERVRVEFADDPRVRVYRKENGGKASALNHGIAMTETDVIVAIDGDTVLLPDAIERLIAPFAEPSVGAVAGKVAVGNMINLLTRFQALEYIIGQSLERTAFELFNAIGVVPGAIGAWRREALLQAGGYSTDTLAEDGDLTVTLERNGWRVVNAPMAVALTEAPETLKAFMKQRFRWMFGTLQVAFKHVGVFLERPRGISLVTLPNIFFQFAFTLIAPIMDLALLWILMNAAASVFLVSDLVDNATLLKLGAYWLAFQVVDLFTAGVGLALHGERSKWRLLPLVILQRVTYRQLLYVTAIRALLAALKGTFVGWGKLVRTGRVAQPIAASTSSLGRKVSHHVSTDRMLSV